MYGVKDPYYQLELLQRRVCTLEQLGCACIQIVNFYSDIDMINISNRSIVVLIDENNNDDESLYMFLKGELKFIQTIA